MEENFYILEGKVDIEVDGTVHTLIQSGQMIHIEPKEVHYVINRYDSVVKMVSTLAPFQEVDKVEVDLIPCSRSFPCWKWRFRL